MEGKKRYNFTSKTYPHRVVPPGKGPSRHCTLRWQGCRQGRTRWVSPGCWYWRPCFWITILLTGLEHKSLYLYLSPSLSSVCLSLSHSHTQKNTLTHLYLSNGARKIKLQLTLSNPCIGFSAMSKKKSNGQECFFVPLFNKHILLRMLRLSYGPWQTWTGPLALSPLPSTTWTHLHTLCLCRPLLLSHSVRSLSWPGQSRSQLRRFQLNKNATFSRRF